MREPIGLEKFKTAVDISLDAIVAADEGGRITMWNRAAGIMFGYSEAEAAGGSIEIIMPDEYRDARRRGMDRFLATGETKVIGKTVGLEGLRRDGTRFPVELSLRFEKRQAPAAPRLRACPRYPDGLKGDGIPLLARILAVADTIDAMGADRPYRKGKSMDEIVSELHRCRGAQFDPDIVDVFLRYVACATA
ncbi:MAG: PAS domain S-box protein [Deltaproteobacteria bacterium]|nr:PAS domain S-box protein [Deltaproteobacteria bacterium]